MRLTSEDAREYSRDRTCSRETHRYGTSIRVFNTVCPSVGWLNTRLTYGCVKSRRLTRACTPSLLSRLPHRSFSFLVLILRDCIYQNNPADSRTSRFTERSRHGVRFTRQKESIKFFKNTWKFAYHKSTLYKCRTCRVQWILRYLKGYEKEKKDLYDIIDLMRLQKRIDFYRTKNEQKCLRMKTWTRSEM